MVLKNVAIVLVLGCFAFGQTGKARESYDKGLKELEHHKLANAEKQFKAAIAESPDWALAYVELAHVYFQMPKTEPCIAAYEKAKELDEKDHSLTTEERRNVYNNLGVIYAMGHEWEKAIALFEGAIKDDPGYGEYEYNLACTYSEKGDLDTALVHLKKAWELRNSFEFPNVKKDDSFKRWKDDPRFVEVARGMVV